MLDSAGSTLVEWGRQQQQHDVDLNNHHDDSIVEDNYHDDSTDEGNHHDDSIDE